MALYLISIVATSEPTDIKKSIFFYKFYKKLLNLIDKKITKKIKNQLFFKYSIKNDLQNKKQLAKIRLKY